VACHELGDGGLLCHGRGVTANVINTDDLEPWRRPDPTARQQRIDLLVGVAVAAVALFNLTLTSSAGVFALGPPPSWPEQIFWTVAVTLPLAWRRRWPDVVAIVIAVAFLAGQFRSAPEQQMAMGALYASMYTVGAWGRDHRRSARVRLGIVVGMFLALAFNLIRHLPALTAEDFSEAAGPLSPVFAAVVNSLLLNLLFFGFAYFAGETAWTAARREHQLRVQAEQLRASQAEAGERAVMAERLRIARELHDVVAHHVSVMGVQAAAGRRVMDKDPGKARTALAAVEQSARTAVDELRRMLYLLRHSGSAGNERPMGAAGIERVDELLASARDAGLTTTIGVYGDPQPLPESLSQAAYRIVQEAVTNTLKHAAATTLDVRIRYLDRDLELDIADNGHGVTVSSGGGMGLIGMRERVSAHDGVLEVGPRAAVLDTDGVAARGFRVRARFPLSPVAVGA
jgi:signal transduction histidine kinase